jgi:hypothetical protein
MITPRSVGPATNNESGVGINGHTHAVDASPDGYGGNVILKTGSNGEARVKTITGADALFSNRVSAVYIGSPTGNNLHIEAASGRDVILSARKVSSSDYVSGDLGAGFSFFDDTDGKAILEIDKVKVRHSLVAPGGLTARQIQVLTGDTWVTAGGTVTGVSGASSPYTITTQAPHGLQVDDLILATQFAANPANNVSSYLEVITILSETQFVAQDAPSNAAAPAIGYDYARVGNKTNAARRGSVYLATDDIGAPFIDVIHPVASWQDYFASAKTKVRVGHLSGLAGRQANEYGIYAAIPDSASPKRLIVSTVEQSLDNIPIHMFAYVDVANPAVKVVQVDTANGLALLGEAVGSPTARSVSWMSRDWGTVLGEIYYDPALGGLRSTVQTFVGADKVWNAGNDGHGTGLDADTLDGYHASSFVIPSDQELLNRIKNVDGAGSGLDADLLDGQHAAYFLPTHTYNASDVLAKLLTVDGGGSGLDADLLDGQHGAYYARASDFDAYVAVNGNSVMTGNLQTPSVVMADASGTWGVGPGYNGLRIRRPASGNWARAMYFYETGSGSTQLASIGAYGDPNLSFLYMGASYSDTWLKVTEALATVKTKLTAPIISGTTRVEAGTLYTTVVEPSAAGQSLTLKSSQTGQVSLWAYAREQFRAGNGFLWIGNSDKAVTATVNGSYVALQAANAVDPGEVEGAWPVTDNYRMGDYAGFAVNTKSTILDLKTRDFGATVDPSNSQTGNIIRMGRNSNGQKPLAGHFLWQTQDGSAWWDLWVDNSGVLRAVPGSHSVDTEGVAVGSQTSSERFKTVKDEKARPLSSRIADATAALRAVAKHVQPFTYRSGAFRDSEFDGLILRENAPETHRYGMDRDDGSPEGKSLNVITLFGDMIKAFEGVFQRLDALEAASR